MEKSYFYENNKEDSEFIQANESFMINLGSFNYIESSKQLSFGINYNSDSKKNESFFIDRDNLIPLNEFTSNLTQEEILLEPIDYVHQFKTEQLHKDFPSEDEDETNQTFVQKKLPKISFFSKSSISKISRKIKLKDIEDIIKIQNNCDNNYTYNCEECSKNFKTKYSYGGHMSSQHPGASISYQKRKKTKEENMLRKKRRQIFEKYTHK